MTNILVTMMPLTISDDYDDDYGNKYDDDDDDDDADDDVHYFYGFSL